MHVRTFSSGDRSTGKEVLHLAVEKIFWIVSHFIVCLEVARQRRQLLALDDRALKDIGITRVDAYREGTRGFWEIPDEMKPPHEKVRSTEF